MNRGWEMEDGTVTSHYLFEINALPTSTPFLPEAHIFILYLDSPFIKWKDY